MIKRLYENAAAVYYALATIALMLLSVLLFVASAVEVASSFRSHESITNAALDSVGLLIIGFAIVETAKFIAEEEILSKRELRSSSESRRSLTKFVTIIVIATSLEALVMTFSASRTNVEDAKYSALLFIAAMFSLVCLGCYQWLSSRIYESDNSREREE